MWKKLKQAATNCFVFFAKCGRFNSSIDDDLAEILENLVDDADELPAHLGLHMPYYVAAATSAGMRARPLLHRPDVACARRASAPEVLERLRLALRELCDSPGPPERSPRDADACRLLCLYDPTSGFVDRQAAPTDCCSF